jgi:hypothetical protein
MKIIITKPDGNSVTVDNVYCISIYSGYLNIKFPASHHSFDKPDFQSMTIHDPNVEYTAEPICLG